MGARGVGGGYARTEAEMEQIMDSINEQEVKISSIHNHNLSIQYIITPLIRIPIDATVSPFEKYLWIEP